MSLGHIKSWLAGVAVLYGSTSTLSYPEVIHYDPPTLLTNKIKLKLGLTHVKLVVLSVAVSCPTTKFSRLPQTAFLGAVWQTTGHYSYFYSAIRARHRIFGTATTFSKLS